MNIFLFGRNGQVGRLLESGLSEYGRVTAVCKQDVDVGNIDAVLQTLNRISPTLIVNAASFTDVEGAESNKAVAQAVNAVAPKTMADWAARNQASIIHYSTDYVYDGAGDEYRTEEAPPSPLNVYGATKLAGDIAVAESGAPYLILRTSWLYAACGKNFLKTMLALAAERAELSVVCDQVGAPTSASFVAEATLNILSKNGGDPAALLRAKAGTYHIVCAGETSWHGFAAKIFEGARRRGASLKVRNVHAIPASQYPSIAIRPKNSRLSCEKLQTAFGIRAPYWESALDRVLDQIYC